MLSQLQSLSPRRLIAMGLVVVGALIAVLLIILWQVGLFDSAPPPVSLESAVESIRQDEQQQQSQTQQVRTQQESSLDQDIAQQTEQEQQDSQSTEDLGQQDQQSTGAEQEQGTAQAGDAQSEQQQSTEPDQDQQDSAQQQAGQQAVEQQAAPQEQSNQQESDQTQSTAGPPMLGELAGTWTLSEQGTSFVGYRIGEELANIGTATAVGRTSDIVATLVFDGVMITSVIIEADLRTLTSDQSFRDGALRTRGIETDTYPVATFALVQPIPIAALPVGEETLSVTVNGTLDLHGVTNPVSIALQGQIVDRLVVVVGSTEIALADYNIEPPTGFRVLSIDEIGVMEFQLVLERAP